MSEERVELEYRMYALSLRQLSPINKGVQNTHACLEYANKYHSTPEYRRYIEVDKTLIMLDAGTSQDMLNLVDILSKNEINHTPFKEPDLYDIITSVALLVDERVWNSNKYIHSFDEYYNHIMQFYNTDLQMCDEPPTYEDWLSYIGGPKNEVLISLLAGKRLSNG